MAAALARHDELCRAVVAAHGGRLVKMTGDGMHAVFDDPADAVAAALELQQGLSRSPPTAALAFKMRCGLHARRVAAARQRLLRRRSEPRRAHHERRRTAGRSCCRRRSSTSAGPTSARMSTARPRPGPAARPVEARGRLAAAAPELRQDVPAAALARRDAEQPAAAADVASSAARSEIAEIKDFSRRTRC